MNQHDPGHHPGHTRRSGYIGRVKWLGGALVVVLLTLGVWLGAAAATLRADPAPGPGEARPAAASSPSVPVDPPPVLEPDPDAPALATELPLVRQQLGTGGFSDSVLAPKGWVRTDTFSSEATWRVEDNPTNTYVLRQEQVSAMNQSAAGLLANRIGQLETAVEDFTLLDRGEEAIDFTYVSGGYLRHAFIRWVDLGGTESADIEVALTGRARDVPGMAELIERAAAGAQD